MPNANRTQTVYLATGNPDTQNEVTPYRPGQLGQAFDVNDRMYQVVTLDSGATAATPTGAVTAGQLAFWKDRSTYTVTNDKRFADTGATNYFNTVAGIFRSSSLTAGAQICVLQRGRSISVASDGSGAIGDIAVAKQAVSTGVVTNVAAGTAPVSQVVGTIVSVAANSLISVDVDIPNIP